MTEAIALWWWVFLIAAVAVTLVDVYLLARVVKLSREISILAAKALPAVGGIASHTGVADRLGRTSQVLAALGVKSGELESLTETVGKRLAGGKEK